MTLSNLSTIKQKMEAMRRLSTLYEPYKTKDLGWPVYFFACTPLQSLDIYIYALDELFAECRRTDTNTWLAAFPGALEFIVKLLDIAEWIENVASAGQYTEAIRTNKLRRKWRALLE